MVEKCTVHIRKNKTGEIKILPDFLEWHGDFIWEEGNFACDCNRHDFFNENSNENYPCGHDDYSVKIFLNGEEVYNDMDENE